MKTTKKTIARFSGKSIQVRKPYQPKIINHMTMLPSDSNKRLFIFIEVSKAKAQCVLRSESGKVIYPLAEGNYAYPKHDGWRIQLHKSPDEVRLFSVSGKDFTGQFGAFARAAQTQLDNNEVILDIELVGFNSFDKHVSPRSIRMASDHRGFVLDILYLNGRDTTMLPTRERISLLQSFMTTLPVGILDCVSFRYISTEQDWINLWQQTVERFDQGFDGVIIKLIEATYFERAIKVKQEEHIDVTVVGAFREAKSGNLKALLLGAYSTMSQRWIPITQVTPDKAENWEEIIVVCQQYILPAKPTELELPSQRPQLWFSPNIVLEVALTEWRDSPLYPISPDRIKKYWLRAEKGAGQATTFEEIGEIENWIHSQEQKNSQTLSQLTLFDDADSG